MAEIAPYKYEFVASTDISADSLVTFVPGQLIMSTKSALNRSPTCMNIQAKGLLDSLKSTVYTPLAIYLMEQKRDPESHWAAYLAAMNPD